MNLHSLWAQQDAILSGVFLILIVMSIITWCVILIRSFKLLRAKKSNKRFNQKFWNAHHLSDAIDSIKDEQYSPMAQLAIESIQSNHNYHTQKYSHLQNAVPLDEYLTRHIRYRLDKILRPYSSGLTALASIGATAPFIGLFGTVWGIYHALINIGQEGQVTIATVSAPIGEALIATAAGLFAAIPAVLAYNALTRANKNLAHTMDNFAYDLHVQLLTSQDENHQE